MKQTTLRIFIWIVVGIIGIAAIWSWVNYTSTPGDLDSFVTCLKDKGAVFYGAFWCPHCQNQKALFKKSAKLLPYVECSTPDGRSQLQVCADKKIEGYPTWEFAGGERLSGEISLKVLAEKTGCVIPEK